MTDTEYATFLLIATTGFPGNVAAHRKAAELLRSATQESSYIANNVPSQSLKLLR